MTRYTNIARKRTYVEAGFSNEDNLTAEIPAQVSAVTCPVVHENTSEAIASSSNELTSEVVKKKRKRSRNKKQRDTGEIPGEGEEDGPRASEVATAQTLDGQSAGSKGPMSKSGKKKLRERRAKDAATRKIASERRRLKRQDDRHVNTTCYACRETGHAARDCPATLGNDPSDPVKEGKSGKPAARAVGICYRCGSKRHTLARCNSSVDPTNPLPFASCFVCSGKGHLASSCPQNQAKGVYPNGGCCKLCGETTHLAKNCEMRKKDITPSTAFFGTGREAGADEDDFHTFKRRTAEVSHEEKVEEKLKKMRNVKVGAHSGVVKSFGPTVVKPKKVVSF